MPSTNTELPTTGASLPVMETTLVHAVQLNELGHETLTNKCVAHEESYNYSMLLSLKLLSSAYSDSSSESSEESK